MINENNYAKRRISLAPMMDWTDRFYRYFLRQISTQMYLYTEMVTTGAILRGDKNRHLDFDGMEHPIALQLGGSDPKALAECAKIAEDWGYDEVNLNVGCPSDRVQSGMFGACLMFKPALVAECVSAMKSAVSIPVTVKTRLGVDESDSWEFLEEFITVVKEAGCYEFIVHARKAWLKGLSPKENRTVPPLDYEKVYRVKEKWPELEISINGGFRDLDEVEQQLKFVDGVMIGREAYENPYKMIDIDNRFYGLNETIKTRREVLESMLPFIEKEMKCGHPMNRLTRHMLGLYHGVPGGRYFRRTLTEGVAKGGGDMAFIKKLISELPVGV
jgi:tRNA-dihydrouridine synthase A